MNEFPAQSATTPSHRRAGRGNVRVGGQKAYASENDAATEASHPYPQAPQTPDKVPFDSNAFVGSQAAASGSKQRSRPKSRPKNLSTSPESARHTPPQRPVSMKTGPTPAFAGATFHASPAPSALPIPSFLSRAPAQSPKNTDEFLQQSSTPGTDASVPTPRQESAPARSHESPLDFMFRAHKKEQERQRTDSSTGSRPNHLTSTSPGPHSPFELNDSPNRLAASPNGLIASQPRRAGMRRSASGIDSFELDGTPGQPMGPAFSTPYQDRIRAARSNPGHSAGYEAVQRSTDSLNPEDSTEALKKFLFGGGGSAVSSSPGRKGATVSTTGNHSNMTPSVPGYESTKQGRSSSIQAMENDLRKILKMDLAPDV